MARYQMNSDLDQEQINSFTGRQQDNLEIAEDLEKTTFSSFLKNFEKIIVKSLPAIIVMVNVQYVKIFSKKELSIFTTIINLYYVTGNRGILRMQQSSILDIVGVGFGTIWLNLTIKGILLNTNMSIGVIMNKHFRDKNYFKIGICYQRGLLISGIYLIVITPVLAYSRTLFSLIGIEENIAEPAILYAWEAIPSIWAFAFFDITKCYLQSQNSFYPLIVIQFFTAIVHLSLAKTLIINHQLSVRGAAWSKNISDTLQALLVYLYIFKYKSNEPSWVEWDKAALKSIVVFSKSLVQVALKHYIQGASFEILVFFAVHLTFTDFTVCVCLAFTAQAVFMVFVGVSQVVQVTIRQHFRSMDFQGAKARSLYFIISSLIIAIILSEWVQMFGLDESGSSLLLSTYNIFVVTIIIDAIQIMMASILNSVGQHTYTLNVQLIAQYGVGIVSAVYFAYRKQKGVIGLWEGWAYGFAVSVFFLLIKVTLIDWIKSAKSLLVVKRRNAI